MANHHVAINMSDIERNQGHNSKANAEYRLHNGHSQHNGHNQLAAGAPRSRAASMSPNAERRGKRNVETPQQSRSPRDLESAANDAEPLLETDLDAEIIPKPRPPIAHPERDDDDDEATEVPDIPNTPDAHPGVDDGFFPGNLPPVHHHHDDVPELSPRIGGDDSGDVPSTNDKGGPANGVIPRRPSFSNNYPYVPGYNPNVFINADGDSQTLPDVNVYQHKKTLAQGMMDLALLSANANQLRYVLESYSRHPYYYFSLVFISMSIVLQVAVGVGLIWNSRYNVKNQEHICKADRINNFTIIGIFMITVVNVFISSFGVADPPADMKG